MILKFSHCISDFIFAQYEMKIKSACDYYQNIKLKPILVWMFYKKAAHNEATDVLGVKKWTWKKVPTLI